MFFGNGRRLYQTGDGRCYRFVRFGKFPWLVAATVANYCPSRMVEHPKVNPTQVRGLLCHPVVGYSRRAVMIPGLELAAGHDRSMILTLFMTIPDPNLFKWI